MLLDLVFCPKTDPSIQVEQCQQIQDITTETEIESRELGNLSFKRRICNSSTCKWQLRKLSAVAFSAARKNRWIEEAKVAKGRSVN